MTTGEHGIMLATARVLEGPAQLRAPTWVKAATAASQSKGIEQRGQLRVS
jgi:hypothetical protein